eukprot:454987-Amorphochlora_amoeboformis.AAC.2
MYIVPQPQASQAPQQSSTSSSHQHLSMVEGDPLSASGFSGLSQKLQDAWISKVTQRIDTLNALKRYKTMRTWLLVRLKVLE